MPHAKDIVVKQGTTVIATATKGVYTPKPYQSIVMDDVTVKPKMSLKQNVAYTITLTDVQSGLQTTLQSQYLQFEAGGEYHFSQPDLKAETGTTPA